MLYPRTLVNLLPTTKNRINAISRKAMRRGLTLQLSRLTYTLSLTSQIANSFGRPLSQVTVCTIFSPAKLLLTDLNSFVRGNIHISFPLFNIRSLEIVMSIVVYLSMYNLPLVTSRQLVLVLASYISS